MGQRHILRRNVISNPVAAGFLRGNGGCAASYKWIQHHIIGISVQLDAASRQFQRKRCRMSCLPGRLSGELPHALGPLQKILSADGRLLQFAFRFLASKVSLQKTRMYSCTSLRTGFDGERQLPQAQDDPALACLFHMI